MGFETRIRKTNPEQTLSVPVVFRNRLKFNECVSAAVTRARPRKDAETRLLGAGTGGLALNSLQFSRCPARLRVAPPCVEYLRE
ncbi:MAG: hypothetical protein E5X74_09485 [Mesorhizobium sp.]|uniref:hypothetical protein n=1 Tax=Mesorhizobium sp. TaxID=1871066 RepID=UPI00120B7452|nr:hypothetical protein [Mesorhizobium sp.]TIO54224.1 MAG: hypothetical protein E5X78_05575 [Mesorhizobium sp.]TIO59963.1 MAG: hypothetical protein E5X79_14660 [Mesorhizobium sp.]TIO79227.1 MAG: hypothetical protein E5X75_01360 [Mesorhizobium sp.]TIO85842.1 MAG: hypothetical protein E5X74_09485 [Mesorhizobium sp.]TJV63739.1 MAG: hypothetical protein E5X80_16105 [Mesorhizobium sp.]